MHLMGLPKILTLVFLLTLLSNLAEPRNMALETNDVADLFISTSINFIFDIFLKHYTRKLIEEGKTNVRIENFDRSFSTKILSMDIEGAFNIDDGICGNLSTLHRTGDADMSRTGGEIVLSTHLGLTDLKVDFDNYDISLLGIHQKGKIHVTIGDNSLWLRLNVQTHPECAVYLSEFKIEHLKNVQVDITDLGVFENLTDEITSWVVDEVVVRFRRQVELEVLPQLAKVIKNADICHYLPI